MMQRAGRPLTRYLRRLLIGLGLLVSAGCQAPAPSADFHVSPDGDDAWSGRAPSANATRSDGPFATLARAQQALRELRAQQGTGRDRPYVVLVRGGTYYLNEPLVLGPQDSGTADAPVIYQAQPGEEVVLSGGRPITGWRRHDEGELFVADVPRARIAGTDGTPWVFRQLFCGGERQIRARTPNPVADKPYTGGWVFVQPEPEKNAGFGISLVRIHSPGDTFVWNVDVPADGEYALWFRYGAQNKPHGRTTMAGRTTIQVDGGKPVVLSNLADTGDWSRYRWAKTATLELKKGTHRLRWTNVKGGGLDFDAFVLCDDPGYTPKGKLKDEPASGKHRIVVQAETFTRGKSKEHAIRRARHAIPKDRFRFRPGDIRPWPRSPEPEVHIFPAWGWVNALLSVERIDHEDHLCHVTNSNCTQELRPGNRYFVENVFEALDMPGEWFLDRRQGRLYYWPAFDDFAGLGVVAPVLDRLIEIAGEPDGGAPVEHIVFRGFTFRHTRYSLAVPSVYSPQDGTLWLRNTRHCVIEGCSFLGVGGYGVRMSERSCHNAVVDNLIVDGGQGGVLLVGHETSEQARDNLIAGNRIHHCGRIWKHVAGVYVTTGSGNRIAHNTVTDVPRYGISLKSYQAGHASHGNIVEYNRLLRTNLETNDTGAIETLGRDREDTGNVIRYNLILDVVGLKTSETGEIMTPYYTWGIYLDDFSSGTTVVGNIVARTFRGGMHVHLGRNNVFMNNIVVDGRLQQTEYNGHDFMANNVFARNIVSFRQGRLLRVRRWHDKVLARCDSNLYWKVSGGLDDLGGDLTPKGSLEAWRAAGYDRASVVADPMFVDPENDDYRLRENSPARLIGFEPIPVERIGARGYVRPKELP